MLILNEKKYAEDLYFGKNNEVKSVTAKIGYVTRYQLHVLGYNDQDNYIYTVKWMNKHHDNFDESCYSKLVTSAVKKAHKRPFFNVEDLIITKSELDIISSLNNLREEKISLIQRFIFYEHEVAFLSLLNRSDPKVMQTMWLIENQNIAISLLPQLQVKFLAE